MALRRLHQHTRRRVAGHGPSNRWRGSPARPDSGAGNPERDVITWSPELLGWFGLRTGPLVSYAAFLETIVDEDRGTVAAQIDAARVHGHDFGATFSCTGAKGRDLWFHIAGRRMIPPSGYEVAGICKYLSPPPSWWTSSAIGCG